MQIVLGRPTTAVVVVAATLTVRIAAADDIAAAAAAFERAQAAELSGRHGQAAKLYELAYRIKPAAAALRGAIRMRLAAGDDDIAATHAETLLRRHPNDKVSRMTADRVLAHVAPRVTGIAIACDGLCVPVVDGKLVSLEPARKLTIYVQPGRHTVAVSFGRHTTDMHVFVGTKGQQVKLSFEPPSENIAASRPSTPTTHSAGLTGARSPVAGHQDLRRMRRISPWYFGVAAAAALGLVGATLWSGLDVLQAYDEYDRSAPNAPQLYADGTDRELRTNVLIGVTAGVAAVAVVLAVFTRWSGPTADPHPRSEAQRTVILVPQTHGTNIGVAASW